jgi:hypothetical protein
VKNLVIEQIKIPHDIYSEIKDRIRLGLTYKTLRIYQPRAG